MTSRLNIMSAGDTSQNTHFWKSIWPTLIGGGSWALLGRLIVIVSGLIVNVILTRMMPPDDIGNYFLAISIISLFTILLPLGFDQIIVKFVSESIVKQQGKHIRQALKFSYFVYFLSSTGLFILYFSGFFHWLFLVTFDNKNLQILIFIILMSSITIGLTNLSAQSLRGFQKFKHAILFQNIFPSFIFTAFIAAAFLINIKIDVTQVFLILILANLVSFILSIAYIRRAFTGLNSDGHLEYRQVLSITTPVWLSAILMYCLSQSDIWIVAAFMNDPDVAVYGSVTRLVAFITMPLLIANTVLPSIITDLFTKTETENLEKSLRYSAAITSLPAILVTAIYLLAGEKILAALFTDFYGIGYHTLVILSLGQIINVYLGSCGWALIMTGNQMMLLKITVVTGALTVLLALSLVNEYGLEGVAFAVSIGVVIQNVAMLIYTKFLVGVWTYADFSVFNNMIKAHFVK